MKFQKNFSTFKKKIFWFPKFFSIFPPTFFAISVFPSAFWTSWIPKKLSTRSKFKSTSPDSLANLPQTLSSFTVPAAIFDHWTVRVLVFFSFFGVMDWGHSCGIEAVGATDPSEFFASVPGAFGIFIWRIGGGGGGPGAVIGGGGGGGGGDLRRLIGGGGGGGHFGEVIKLSFESISWSLRSCFSASV